MVHLKVVGGDSTPWLLSAVYGSPHRVNRRILWSNLRSLAGNITIPWCLLGDFNATLHDYEQRGGSTNIVHSACPDFQRCISDCGLIDLGFVGWPFTWRRGNIVERLDRGLNNLEWKLSFPEGILRHLPNFNSDHSPICLQLHTASFQNRNRRPFRFVAAWLAHPDFSNLVSNSWDVSSSWNSGVVSFKNSLKDWNTNIFGDIFKRKRTLLRRLQGIASSLATSVNRNYFLENL
ncbi:uncharacterized protein [Arachis hypogaea]|uniref:uncharacterized protein n=1 Tax=Arachis hypogaea TaxID=3818 RepID=UPI0007AF5B55